MGDSIDKGISLRRTLIVFQLMIAQALVVSTIIVVQQLNYVSSQPLGLNSNAVVEFELPENKPELIHLLNDRLKNIPGVESVTMSNTGSTSGNSWGGDLEATINNELVKEYTQVKFVNEDFVKTYQLELLYGEDLIESDTATRFLVNEALSKKLGFQNPQDAIGVPVDIWGNKAHIMGVVKDFNSNSLHNKLQPVIMLCGTESFYIGAVRLKTQDMQGTLAQLQKTWESIYPKYVYEYTFLDDTIAKFYSAERKNSKLIGTFAGVAILIGCIGLFGLISFMAQTKTKEVGIRKTLGASVSQIISLFSREFIMLIIVSFVISAPVAYYFMDQWLDNFAYRIHPGITTFLLGVGLIAVVVLATVGFRSYRAAIANPIDALRDE